MDEALRKNVRERWIRTLFEFTDTGYQRRIWLDNFYPGVVSSYTEALCTYFDDLDLNNGYESFVSEGFVTAGEAAIVAPFHDALAKYSGNTAKEIFDNKEVLNDPDWHEVVQSGFTTWQQLRAYLNGTPEYLFVLELEEKYL